MSLELDDIQHISELAGSFEDRIAGAIGRGSLPDVMFLACELANEAMIAERERAALVIQGIIDEDQEEDDAWSSGWRSAGDAFMCELYDIQPEGWENEDALLADEKQRGQQIMDIMQDALDRTMERPINRRGPYVIADNDPKGRAQ